MTPDPHPTLQHNNGPQELIIDPIIHFNVGAVSVASVRIVARGDDTPIAGTGAMTAGINVRAKIDAAAGAGNKLALWLTGVSPYTTGLHADMRAFLTDTLSTLEYKWEDPKFKASKEAKISDSVAAKAIIGAQEKRGDSKTRVEFKLNYWDGWDLSGKIKDGMLITP